MWINSFFFLSLLLTGNSHTEHTKQWECTCWDTHTHTPTPEPTAQRYIRWMLPVSHRKPPRPILDKTTSSYDSDDYQP